LGVFAVDQFLTRHQQVDGGSKKWRPPPYEGATSSRDANAA